MSEVISVERAPSGYFITYSDKRVRVELAMAPLTQDDCTILALCQYIVKHKPNISDTPMPCSEIRLSEAEDCSLMPPTEKPYHVMERHEHIL
jgi:hypothetical protein